MQALLERFRKADTQVLGVSVDSVFSHANWGAKDLGGVSFPLLADFHPKGAVAEKFGHYLSGPGLTDRATVIIDKQGVVRFSKSVTPSGIRDIAELAAECEKVNAGSPAGAMQSGKDLPTGTRLFVKSSCGASRKALLAADNLHIGGKIEILNVSDDKTAAATLLEAGSRDQAPCLMIEGECVFESQDISRRLATLVAPVG